MALSTLQVANPSIGTVSRMPQTTAAPANPNAPFARMSAKSQILGPTTAGLAYGQLWTPQLKPVGGYLRYLNLYATSTGGTGTAAVLSADGPWNLIQNLFFRDPYGQPIIQADGYSLYLIMLYGGQCGMLGFGNNSAGLPSFQAPTTAGNFNARFLVPFELDSSGYGSLADMNAASQPQLWVQTNPLSTVFSVVPTGAPTISFQADEPFWMAPVDNPAVAPPDVGSSAQWSVAKAAQGIAANQYQRIVLPRVGALTHTIICVLRDSTGARVDLFPTTDLTLWIDGVPRFIETLNERADWMYTQFGVARPAGVIVYTFRDSVQSAVSTADTYDEILPTTPATLLEVAGTWGNIVNAPAQLYQIQGELFPLGGIPYTHLAS